MVVALHDEDARFDLRVPEEDVMVKTRRNDHVHISEPDESVHAQFVTLCELMLLLNLDLAVGDAIFTLALFATSGLSSSTDAVLLDNTHAPKSDFPIHGATG